MAMNNIDELLSAMRGVQEQNPTVEVGFKLETWVMIMEYMKALEVGLEQLADKQIDPEALMTQINQDVNSKLESVESTVASKLDASDADKILF